MVTENEFVERLVSAAPNTVRSDGLIYTTQAYEQAVEKLNAKNIVRGEMAVAEEARFVEYPRLFSVNENRVACEAKDFFLTPEGIVAKVRVLDTPFGNAAKGLIVSGLLEKGIVDFRVRAAISKLDMSGARVLKVTPITVDFVIVDFVVPN